MQIVHGTWLPDDTDTFEQGGAFYVWVETDTPATIRKAREPGSEHPRQLSRADLGRFLADKLGLDPGDRYGSSSDRAERLARRLDEKYLLLPSVEGRPLASFELAPYLEEAIPDAFALALWQVRCHRLAHPIADLNQIQFAAQTSAEDFQLGADLQFWQQYAQAIKGIIARDQYIP